MGEVVTVSLVSLYARGEDVTVSRGRQAAELLRIGSRAPAWLVTLAAASAAGRWKQ